MTTSEQLTETIRIGGIELFVEFEANVTREPDLDTSSHEVTEILSVQTIDFEHVSFMDWQYKGQRLDHYLMNNL